jgi:hypothetical protein
MLKKLKAKLKWGNTDGYSRVNKNDIIKIHGWPYKLTFKRMFNLNVCPHCGSEDTFHRARLLSMEERLQEQGIIYENVFRTIHRTEENSSILAKYDLCLKCSHEWVFQIFVYDRTDETALHLAPGQLGG